MYLDASNGLILWSIQSWQVSYPDSYLSHTSGSTMRDAIIENRCEGMKVINRRLLFVIVQSLVLCCASCDYSGNGTNDGGDGFDSDSGSYDKDCPIGRTPCLDEGGLVKCVDLMSEDCHCGSCGTQCLCTEGFGECNMCDGVGMTTCMMNPCISGENKSECVDLSTNPEHCGSCFNACSDSETCVDSACVPTR
jgi:hypothetical protein